MKNNFISLFALGLIINHAGCNLIGRVGYGAKKQKTENKENIIKWLQGKGFSTESVYCLGPELYVEKVLGFPQAPLLFDNATGNFLAIGFANGKYCPKEVDKSFSAVLPYNLLKEKPDSFLISERTVIPAGVSVSDKSKHVKETDSVRMEFKEMISSFKDLDGNIADLKGNNVNDYSLIIPFALFLGNKLQVEDLKRFYFSALQNHFAKINVIFLNLDKQEWWGREWNDKTKIKY